ncbi:MAG: glycerol-3-phosphate 1-O-acyltransferase PlsY [Phycisphaeraceae bacterium]
MTHLQLWLTWLPLAYLAGAIPFGLLIGRVHGVDIRTRGSGNVGATNVGRVLGRKWGVICFLLDVGKGLAAVLGYALAARSLGLTPDAGPVALVGWLAVAAAAVSGHMFPVWLKFRGGKGVATGLGSVLGFWPVLTAAGLAAGAIWVIVVRRSGYVSLGSTVAALALPVLSLLSGLAMGRPAEQVGVYAAVTAGLALLVVVRHRSNLARLRAGTESKVAWGGNR